MQVVRRLVALPTIVALALGPACKQEESPAKSDASVSAAPADAKDPAQAAANAPATAATGTAVAPTSPLAPPPAVVATTSYPATLDSLLDLLPADATQFVVIRDPLAFVRGVQWVLDARRQPIMRAIDSAPPGGDTDGMRRFVGEFAAIRTAIDTSGIELDKGFVIVDNELGKPDVFLFASSRADALVGIATAVTGKPATELGCAAVPAMPGFVACSDGDSKAPSALAPGGRAKALRDELGKALAGVDLERANVLGRVGRDGDAVPFALATAAGIVELDVGIPELRDSMAEVTAPGPAPALGLVSPGGSFVWGRIRPDFIAKRAGDTAPLASAARALTGELAMVGTESPASIAVLAGVSDPAALSGLIALASLAFDQLPKTLEDRTPLEAKLEQVEVTPGTTTQAVHLHAEVKADIAELTKRMGLSPDLFAFSVGKYGAITMGADTKIVGKIAGHTGGAVPPSLLATLPPDLADALAHDRAVFAMHVDLDGLQTPDARALFAQGARAIPPEQRGGVDPEKMLAIAFDLLATVSSIDAWWTMQDGAPVVHVAVRAFGDAETEEGKSATAALAELAGGADSRTTYAALAAKHPSSPRAWSYRVRAGDSATAVASTLGGVFVVGILAAIAIPALMLRKDAPASPPK